MLFYLTEFNCQVFAFNMSVVIITGASSGIGRATAIQLKNQGVSVVGTYFSSCDSASELTKLHGVDMVKCNVSVESDVDYLFEYAEKRFGNISAVISCAGVALEQKTILDVTAQEIDRVVDINLKGALLVNKRAVKSMLSSGGKIINVSSVFGLEGGSCEVLYSATKTGVIGLTRALSEELSGSNVSVCAVAFGLVDTPMNAHLTSEDKLEFIKEYGLSKIPTPTDASEELLKILRLENVNGKTFKVFC